MLNFLFGFIVGAAIGYGLRDAISRLRRRRQRRKRSRYTF
jgi:multisubunit Na+/H+ antiporter MnhE subunit